MITVKKNRDCSTPFGRNSLHEVQLSHSGRKCVKIRFYAIPDPADQPMVTNKVMKLFSTN